MKTIEHYIAGNSFPQPQTATLTKVYPGTGEELYQVPEATLDIVNNAVGSACEGQKQWAQMSGGQRGRILQKAASLIRQEQERLATLEVFDTGKPTSEARTVDIPSSAEAIEYFANLAAASENQGKALELPNAFVYTRREPLGVCAGIGAWNYPLQIACWKSAPCLATGNAMVYKPSELTPMTALALGEIYSRAGVPDGVFNVVLGGRQTGSYLSRHSKIAKVSVTGSVPTGKTVMADAASTLKHVTMELGGKSPLILLPDCDLDEAVSGALMANFFTQGEICSNGTRVFVHKDLLSAFLEKIVLRTSKMKIGDPLDPKTQVGALISKTHLDRVLSYIESGLSEGADLIYGGTVPETLSGKFKGGFFITPTIFAGCSDDMKIVREEIFGPVMSVLSFSELDEVCERANATDYGLAAGVFTRDLKRAHKLIARLSAGTCWINNYNVTPLGMPFGGYKQSGIGRENAAIAMEHYTQIKSVYVELGSVDCPY
jgi:betaine-aldehyde dehydrogenase